jgi:deazaflavin-dependent oxidoreductase (nitroreductase family)
VAAPRTRRLRTVGRRFVNPVTRRVAGRTPGMALVECVGRRTGRRYTTPVSAFRSGSDYVIPLAYGDDVDWLANVEAAGGCRLTYRGRTVALTNPRRFRDPGRAALPQPLRFAAKLAGITSFVRLSPAVAEQP